ncbi:GNAT family N-acetyltransferase [Rudaeicoccus suwonensis]|uniref:Ribosomal protein S18 acetylase RimI-like enzyme n=1 Tax=Rudaeicoccus suwonensis TaxID=657409 RepID=A0A561DU83_9MICO|nr:GNAT family N-acetyltransferase [Rudaeicoccus suwonensis]TWE06911.1 ribosomal protein S18 acetylase RimI-like enzyme [Rudaeicoccus suwonensis]
MTDITVRALGEDDWQVYRDVRLAALRDAPEAFVASATQEQEFDEEFWRTRMARSRRLVAEQDGTVVGVVSIGRRPGGDERVGELFGLWVTPGLRGQGVAWKLVQAGVDQARSDDFGFVAYWVGTDNGRAVAFASSFGFRPTDSRRPMKNGNSDGEEPDEEMAMIFPLGDDPGSVPSAVV